MRRPWIILLAVALAAVLVVGIVQTSGSGDEGDAPTSAEVAKQLAGSPPELAALHDQANQLLPVDGFEARLKELHGYPIVVNVWGSWCDPCRKEFPIFQEVSATYGKRVAFLGLGMQDAVESAKPFLAEHPVSYPTYTDFQAQVTSGKYGLLSAPATVFYHPGGGKPYIHQGRYVSADDLERDIDRYALG